MYLLDDDTLKRSAEKVYKKNYSECSGHPIYGIGYTVYSIRHTVYMIRYIGYGIRCTENGIRYNTSVFHTKFCAMIFSIIVCIFDNGTSLIIGVISKIVSDDIIFIKLNFARSFIQ